MKKRTVLIILATVLLFIIAEPMRLLWQGHVLVVQGNTISHLESELKAQHFRIDPADFQAVAPTSNVAGWTPVRNAFHAFNQHLVADTGDDIVGFDPGTAAYRFVQIQRANQTLTQENPWIEGIAKAMANPNAIIPVDWPLGQFSILNQPLSYGPAMRCLSTRALLEFENKQPEKAIDDLQTVEAVANRMIQSPVNVICITGMKGNLSMFTAMKVGLMMNAKSPAVVSQIHQLVQNEKIPNLETLLEGSVTLNLQGLKLLMSNQASRIDTILPRIQVSQTWTSKKLCQQKMIDILQSALQNIPIIREFPQNIPALQLRLTPTRSSATMILNTPTYRETFIDLINFQNTNTGLAIYTLLDSLNRYIGTRRVESFAVQVINIFQKNHSWPLSVTPEPVDSWTLVPAFGMRYHNTGNQPAIFVAFGSPYQRDPSPPGAALFPAKSTPEFNLTQQPAKLSFKGLTIPLPNL